MKPVVILCEVEEREQLLEWFENCQIKTERCLINTHLLSLNALRILHDSLSEIAGCGIKFGEKYDKTFLARVKTDDTIKTHKISIQNINILLEISNDERFYLLFEHNENNDQDNTGVIV